MRHSSEHMAQAPIWERWYQNRLHVNNRNMNKLWLSFTQHITFIKCYVGQRYGDQYTSDFIWTDGFTTSQLNAAVSRVSIGSDNGLSPIRRQAIIWTNTELLSIVQLGTNFSEILIKKSFTKMHLKITSTKWRPFCPGGDESTNKRYLWFQLSWLVSIQSPANDTTVCRSSYVHVNDYMTRSIQMWSRNRVEPNCFCVMDIK